MESEFHWHWEDVSICHYEPTWGICQNWREVPPTGRHSHTTESMTLQAERRLDCNPHPFSGLGTVQPFTEIFPWALPLSKLPSSALSAAQSQVFTDPPVFTDLSLLWSGACGTFRAEAIWSQYHDLRSWAHLFRYMWARFWGRGCSLMDTYNHECTDCPV